MKILYVTDGTHLFKDSELRTLCLRVPEVLGAIRELDRSLSRGDLLNEISVPASFEALSLSLREQVVSVIQNALQERCLRQKKYDRILYRAQFTSDAEVAKEIRWSLKAAKQVKVDILGPGFDEVVGFLKNEKRIHFEDSLSQDPSLNWFWRDFKKVSSH